MPTPTSNFAAGMHDVKDLLGSVVEEPAAKSEEVSIDLIGGPFWSQQNIKANVFRVRLMPRTVCTGRIL
jgi:hypothetical protein